MQHVKLQLADNGIIKSVFDDNINAAGEIFESTTVYEFNSTENKIKFIEDLCIDIGLEFGNSRSREQIQVLSQWGKDYSPSDQEIEKKIKFYNEEIIKLSSLKNG